MLVTKVVEAMTDPRRHPAPFVVGTLRRGAKGDRGELGGQAGHHRAPLFVFLFDREVNRMAATRQLAQRRVEVAKIGIAIPEEQDLHGRMSPLGAPRPNTRVAML